ncbi:MAG TPA: outer membrane beta-barrel protein [Vicinamibacterales bacterium]|nr:outer membrane beta-barrel protein [Vicinamibacterales bacterium]
MRRLLLVTAALLAAIPTLADAQTPRPPSRPPAARRVEIGAGAGVAGGVTLGERDAALRSNAVTPSPFRLFSTSTSLDSAPFFEVRIGYRMTPRLTVEGTLGASRPTLTSALTADVENAAPVDATTATTEYVITGGAVWRFSTSPRRLTPFVSGGAGVARHVYDGQTLIENGVDGYAGGGVIYALGASRGTMTRYGLRLDGRVHFLSGGVAEGQGVRPRGALSGSIFIAF